MRAQCNDPPMQCTKFRRLRDRGTLPSLVNEQRSTEVWAVGQSRPHFAFAVSASAFMKRATDGCPSQHPRPGTGDCPLNRAPKVSGSLRIPFDGAGIPLLRRVIWGPRKFRYCLARVNGLKGTQARSPGWTQPVDPAWTGPSPLPPPLPQQDQESHWPAVNRAASPVEAGTYGACGALIRTICPIS